MICHNFKGMQRSVWKEDVNDKNSPWLINFFPYCYYLFVTNIIKPEEVNEWIFKDILERRKININMLVANLNDKKKLLNIIINDKNNHVFNENKTYSFDRNKNKENKLYRDSITYFKNNKEDKSDINDISNNMKGVEYVEPKSTYNIYNDMTSHTVSKKYTCSEQEKNYFDYLDQKLDKKLDIEFIKNMLNNEGDFKTLLKIIVDKEITMQNLSVELVDNISKHILKYFNSFDDYEDMLKLIMEKNIDIKIFDVDDEIKKKSK